MIEISHLTKKYGAHAAVDDLSLTVEPGKIYGFLGPNGAGKSTTMNLITGYLGATEGTVKIDGFDVLAQPEEAKRCVGYLPEQPPLYPEMTVLEYLLFAAELKKLKKEERKGQVNQVMEQTGITEVKNRLIRNLSKGYKQRVGLAQAILGDPKVILLDEPTVGLDPKQIIEMRNLIKELGKAHTVILSSHILQEISAVCDHIFIISHGKLVASDSAGHLGHLMSGKPEILLKAKGEKEEIKKVLEGIDGVLGYQFEDRQEGEAEEAGGSRPQIWQVTVELAGAEEDRDTAKEEQAGNDEVAASEEEQHIFAKEEQAGNDEVAASEEKQHIFAKEEIQERLFFAFAEARLPILELRTEEKSLEDVFLSLTKETGGEE